MINKAFSNNYCLFIFFRFPYLPTMEIIIESRGRQDILMYSTLLYYVNNLFMLIHEWRCEDIISWVLLKTGLMWS